MCYSIESSLKTTSISLLSIIYLLTSKIPHFQWIGITLIGWCLMQFAELLLWLTDPRKECTIWNKIITMTLIPLALVLQPLGPLFGSLYVIPWNKSNELRKKFIIFYTAFIIICESYVHFYNPEKICTTVTKNGHLYWTTQIDNNATIHLIQYFIWAFLILLPLFTFWNKSIIFPLLLILMPTFGFIVGIKSDARASIWCHYTSYTSIISSIILFLHQSNIYKLV